MHPETPNLYVVHLVDVRLLNLDRVLRNLDNGDTARVAVVKARRALAAAEAALKQTRVQQADAEGMLKAKEESRQAHEKRLYGGLVKKMDEVTAVEHEIAALKAAAGELETSILETMDAVEAAETLVTELHAAVNAREAELTVVVRQYNRDSDEANAQVKVANSERAAAAAIVSAPVLAKYDSIRKKTKDTGLALVDGHICGGCRLPVPQLTMNALTGTQDLVTCDTCGRILFREAAAN
jgi:uncharacterized protein